MAGTPFNPAPLTARAGFGDARGVESLRQRAAQDPKAAVREAAKQFESLFMQELLKSMRQSAQSTGMLDNEATKLGSEMLDTQWAGKLSGLPGGLSDVIARQLERQMGMSPGPIPKPDSASRTPVSAAPIRIPQQAALGFVQQHQAAASKAEAATGIPASFMLAQAAHETGWGRKEIRHADGSAANNLFGIKAGPNWNGPVAEVATTEYVNGQPQKTLQKFRSYASHAESFADYAKLMKTNPRYEQVVASANDARGFAQGLQRAGYATDPAYAEKLTRVINTTLRLQRSATA
jgi:flagellar protein FlgJ